LSITQSIELPTEHLSWQIVAGTVSNYIIKTNIQNCYQALIRGKIQVLPLPRKYDSIKTVLVKVSTYTSVLFRTSGRRGLAITFLELREMQREVGKTFLTSTLIVLAGIVMILLLMGILIRNGNVN
jgi:hypothetical protein